MKEASYQQENRCCPEALWSSLGGPRTEGQRGSFFRLHARGTSCGRMAETWCALPQASLQASPKPGEFQSVFSYTVRDLRSHTHKSKVMSDVQQLQRIAVRTFKCYDASFFCLLSSISFSGPHPPSQGKVTGKGSKTWQ